MGESLIYDLKSASWIKSPTGAQIKAVFAKAAANGGSSIDDIIVKWRAEDGSDWKDLHVAIASDAETCFVARITREKDIFELLVWYPDYAASEAISIFDHGGGEWFFSGRHRAPVSEIIAFVTDFSESGEMALSNWELEAAGDT